jgi:hypothetical protein
MMSYCRWSSDHFNCDLYCYEDTAGGYTVHVATCRLRTWVRLYNWLTDERVTIGNNIFRLARLRLTGFLPVWLTHRRIGLPHDGATFHEEKITGFYVLVSYLWMIGYRVPEQVLLNLEKEMEAENAN